MKETDRLPHQSLSLRTACLIIVEAFAGKEKIISISAGQHHSGCISMRGDVFTWGKGEHGQLGQGEVGTSACYFG